MLTGPSFIPKNPKQALILFHGYGADGEDLFSLNNFFKKAFPNMAFFTPNAPDMIFGGGYEWFSLNDYFNQNELSLEYLSVLSERAKEKIPLIQEYIEQIQEKTNLQKKDIFIGGFSQGGLMAAQTLFHEKSSFAGLILMSPVPPAQIPTETKKTDVLISRGEEDSVILPEAAKLAAPLFKDCGFQTTQIIDPFAPHAISDMHLKGIIQFIQSHLS